MPEPPLILIPPSEGKAPGGSGPAWAPSTMAIDLDDRRLAVMAALRSAMRRNEAQRQKLLGVKGDALAAATAANRTVAESPTLAAAQRFTDRPYIEIGSTAKELADADFSAADADIIYLSFDSAAARDRADAVLDSPAWRKLSANRDNRVFAVNNEVWQTGQGLVAARGILDDLRWINAPIN